MISVARPRCRHCDKALQKQFADEGKTRLIGYGYAATNLFCSLTCGHWYAVKRMPLDKAQEQAFVTYLQSLPLLRNMRGQPPPMNADFGRDCLEAGLSHRLPRGLWS